MITRVHARGTLVGAALRHAYTARDTADPPPRLVAAWDGSGDLAHLEPPTLPSGGHDTRHLAALLAEPVTAGLNPPTRPVWRCTLELDATDRRLTPPQWADAAREVLDQAGIAPRGDRHAVRWVAVAHGEDRVDIVATLVRQDRRTEPARHDRPRCLAATRALARRYGLAPDADEPSPPPRRRHDAPTPRRGTPASARDRLRRDVRAASIIAADEDDFLARLHTAGLRVRLRRGSADRGVTGYSVSLPGTAPDTDRPVWYSGGQLAPELTLPRLRTRWAQTAATACADDPGVAQPERVWQQAAEAVSAAADDLTGEAARLASDTGHAVADVLAAAARAFPGEQAHRLADAAELLHRAVGGRMRGRPPAPDARAVHLRSLARLIGLMAQLSDHPQPMAALHLVYLLAGFADNLATLRQAQHRRSQAAAARSAAAHLHAAASAQPWASPTPWPPPLAAVLPVTPAATARQHTRRSR